ncbi:MAG: RsmD family RNA methyltransferase [Armatimonadetes bacterium]|nr:RsmD family RNA methyltransferase [Armatimonadota bacterium]
MKARTRVISGAARSVQLERAPGKVRPTTERVRQGLFSSLGEAVDGRPFVDLYAGSGAVGIEALSRGASRCLFVERAAECVRVIKENLARTQLAARAQVWRRDVGRAIEDVVDWLADEPGILFADPPYGDRHAQQVWSALLSLASERLASGTLLVLEHSVREDLYGLPKPSWQRRVGETCLSRWETRPDV